MAAYDWGLPVPLRCCPWPRNGRSRAAAQPDVVACARRRRDGVAPSLKPGAAGRPSGAA